MRPRGSRDARPITVVDLCAVTGYSRDRMQGLLRRLPRYAAYGRGERVTREFSRVDFLVIAVAAHLESAVGLRREEIANIIDLVHHEVIGAHALVPAPRLHVLIDPQTVRCVIGTQDDDGAMVALCPLTERIDDYLNRGTVPDGDQRELPLSQPLVAVRR